MLLENFPTLVFCTSSVSCVFGTYKFGIGIGVVDRFTVGERTSSLLGIKVGFENGIWLL